MNERTYPYKAWLLTRSFEPKEVELVARGFTSSVYDRTHSGRNYHIDELHPSLEAAIACGESRLVELTEELSRRLSTLEKRRDQLQRFKPSTSATACRQ